MAAKSSSSARGGRKSTGKAKAARTASTETVRAAGKKPITFKKGGLHQSLGVPEGQPIPSAKMAGALNGQYGPKAAAQARFAQNVLTGPKSGGASKPTRTRGASRGSKSR
jgi:hypothetical protein